MSPWTIVSITSSYLAWICLILIYIGKCRPCSRDTKAQVSLLCVAVALVVFLPRQISKERDEALDKLMTHTWEEVYGVLLQALGYVAPFVLYPLVVFWIKIIVNSRSRSVGSGANATMDVQYDLTLQQSILITFALKGMVTVYFLFHLFDSMGIQTNDVIDIGTVFSVGLGWSMRGWLGNMWSSLMIAFTTKLSTGSSMSMGTAISADRFDVKQTGLMFTTCTKSGDSANPENDVYIPNSVLTSSGFVVYK